MAALLCFNRCVFVSVIKCVDCVGNFGEFAHRDSGISESGDFFYATGIEYRRSIVGHHSHSSSRPAHHQNLHQKFFSDDNNQSAENPIQSGHSTNKLELSSLSMNKPRRQRLGDKHNVSSRHKYIVGQISFLVSFEGGIVRGRSFVRGIVRRSRIKNIGVSIEYKLLTLYRSSIIFSCVIVIFPSFSLFHGFRASASPGRSGSSWGSRNSSLICPTYWPKLKKSGTALAGSTGPNVDWL
jgi:hypothetical protein